VAPDELYVLGRRALLALDEIELHALTLGEGLEALALDRAVVDEAVFLTVFEGDEAKSLGVVEPFHCTCGAHLLLLQSPMPEPLP
jgi:hypothetical protein